ncbi:hypothetical protein [Leuconostoc citreum]|uniref:hypothetical protein n=1 Tax=Leuconostoc citreum TaxID=33964 RepID=UPI0032E03BE0
MSKRKKKKNQEALIASHYPPIIPAPLTTAERQQRAALKKAKKRVEQKVSSKTRYDSLSKAEKKAIKAKQRHQQQLRKARELAALEVTHYSHQKPKVRFIKHK